jgi:hypothetical protein
MTANGKELWAVLGCHRPNPWPLRFVGLAVSRNAGSLFGREIGPVNPELAECLSWDKNLSERAFGVIHFVSAFIALLSRPARDVLWFTDED